MTYSETKFREHLKKVFGEKTFIHKMPDLKQGARGIPGMPDYLCISKGKTMWFEVKTTPSKKVFNFNLISESQYIIFDKMHNAGAAIYIAIYLNKELYIVPYKEIQTLKFLTTDTSISVDKLYLWRAKWIE